jgi:hypothetical protein
MGKGKLIFVSLLQVCCLTFWVANAFGNSYTGFYFTEQPEQFLILEQQVDGSVLGLLERQNMSFEVKLGPAEDKMIGVAQDTNGVSFPLLVQLHQGTLYFKMYQADERGHAITESGVQYDFQRMPDSAGLPQHGAPSTGPEQNYPPLAPNAGNQQPQSPQSPGYGGSSIAQLQQALTGRHVLISFRNGGAVYGTYTFLNTHYCASGRYVVYASTQKQSVLGGENTSSWEIHGTWQVTQQGGQTGVYYRDDQGGTEFLAMQLTPQGVYLSEGVSFSPQGPAQCYP